MGLNYYADMKDAPLYALLRQASIKTEKLWPSLILVGKIFHTLSEAHEHILYVIKVVQLIMAHVFQDQFLNQGHKLSTI